jgi:hypothetical protein
MTVRSDLLYQGTFMSGVTGNTNLAVVPVGQRWLVKSFAAFRTGIGNDVSSFGLRIPAAPSAEFVWVGQYSAQGFVSQNGLWFIAQAGTTLTWGTTLAGTIALTISGTRFAV